MDHSLQGFFADKAPVYSIAVSHLNPEIVVRAAATITRICGIALPAIFATHSDSVCAVAFSADGSLVASGGLDGNLYIFSVEFGGLVCTLQGPSEITWIDWHPRGNIILAGGEDGTCSMWAVTANGGDCMQVFSGHSDSVTCGKFTPDGCRKQ